MSPLLAPSGHSKIDDRCPLSEVKQTSVPLTINLEMGAEYRQLTGDSLENVNVGCGASLSGRGQS